MKVGPRFFLACGFCVLLSLVGCGRSMLQGERAAWRSQAEAQCMQAGAVKMGAGIVKIDPIEGPGMCGADFPLKVAAIGESSSARYGYSDNPPRPPGGVGGSSMPNWPDNRPRYAPPPQPAYQPAPAPAAGQMRWMQGPPPIGAPAVITPQGVDQPNYDQAPPRQVYTQPSYGAPQPVAPGYPPARGAAPMPIHAPGVAAPDANDDDDIPDDAILPNSRGAAPPVYRPQPQASYTPPPLGPPRDSRFGPMNGPQSTAAIMPATMTPAATLSCPIVSALDRWVSQGIQPAAMRWFGVQVTEIRQISAYSCRQMNGAGGRGISEHAFGNALDIAGFTLADGRKIVIKNAWRRGTPEEQGFLHDVQKFACDTFNTVLAPGYNAAHYDHIHVDLMRRANGRRPCRPQAIPGEVVAAKARAIYAARGGGKDYTGSIGAKSTRKPSTIAEAIAGADGLGEDEEEITGSIGSRASDDDIEFEPPPPPKQRGWPQIVPQRNSSKSPADF